LKHGQFTREVIAARHEIAELISNARQLVMTIS
jgi:hypothetical protein